MAGQQPGDHAEILNEITTNEKGAGNGAFSLACLQGLSQPEPGGRQ